MTKLCANLLAILAVVAALPAQQGMLSFNGEDSGWVSAPHSSTLVPSQITIEAWVYYDPADPGGGGAHPTICRKFPGTFGFSSYQLRIDSPQNRLLSFAFRRPGNNNTSLMTVGNPLPTSTWCHVAATYDGVNAMIYVNGQLQQSLFAPGTIEGVGGELYLGLGAQGSERWSGHLDEIRIWSIARTQTELTETMYEQLDNVPGLVGAFHFDNDYSSLTGPIPGTANMSATIIPSTSPLNQALTSAPIAASIGATTSFQIRTPEPLSLYIFDISLNGVGPGIPLPSPAVGTFPLNPPLINLETGPHALLTDFAGATGFDRKAYPSLSVPSLPTLIGTEISGAFIVVNPAAPGGIAMVSSAASMTVVGPAPTIQSIGPSTSPSAGGSIVTIFGSNFESGASVAFGGNTASNVTHISSTELRCLTPAHTIGNVDVRVTNPGGAFTIAHGMFAYVETLTVSSVSPQIPVPGGLVTVIGTGFVLNSTVQFSGLPVPATIASSTQLSFFAPTVIPCGPIITVINPDQQTATISPDPSVNISLLAPPLGPSAGGNMVFVLGDHFDATCTVTFGAVSAVTLSLTPTAILVMAPPGAVGTTMVTVSNASGCTDSSPYIYN